MGRFGLNFLGESSWLEHDNDCTPTVSPKHSIRLNTTHSVYCDTVLSEHRLHFGYTPDLVLGRRFPRVPAESGRQSFPRSLAVIWLRSPKLAIGRGLELTRNSSHLLEDADCLK